MFCSLSSSVGMRVHGSLYRPIAWRVSKVQTCNDGIQVGERIFSSSDQNECSIAAISFGIAEIGLAQESTAVALSRVGAMVRLWPISSNDEGSRMFGTSRSSNASTIHGNVALFQARSVMIPTSFIGQDGTRNGSGRLWHCRHVRDLSPTNGISFSLSSA